MMTKRNWAALHTKQFQALQLLELTHVITDAERHKVWNRVLKYAQIHGVRAERRGFRDIVFTGTL